MRRAAGLVPQSVRVRNGLRADESQEAGRTHGPPSLLGGLDEFEDHGQGGGCTAGAPGDLGPGAIVPACFGSVGIVNIMVVRVQYVIFRPACHRSMVWTLGSRCRSDVRDSLNSGMSMRKPYSSDVSDEQWLLVEPVITAWKVAHPPVSGHQGRYAMREIVNAILYQNRSGCQWDLLPHDLPPAGAVKY